MLIVAAPVGTQEIALGGALLSVCALIAAVAVARVRRELPPIQRRIFRWLIVGAVLATIGKTWWTADLLVDNVGSVYPSPADWFMIAAQLGVAAAFVSALGRGRPTIRVETIVDVALIAVAAMILLLPMRLGDVAAVQAAPTEAQVAAVLSLFAAAGSLVLLALLVAAHGDEFTRHALLGLAVGAIATSIFTAWAAMLAVSGQPVPHAAMDVVGIAALLGFVSALDLPRGATTLDMRVAERTAHLSGAVEQLTAEIGRERAMRAQIIERERLASIGSIVAGAAHEINNPLSAISAYAQLLLKDASLDTSQRDSVEIIYSETGRAANVIRDLRAFARRGPGGEHRPVDLNELIERILRLRSYQMTTSRLRVETELDEMLAPVIGDGQQLQQVIGNLVENSVQAMLEEGSGTLRLVTKSVNGRVRLEITDSGPGIPPEARDRIFDPFFTTRPEGQGVGLGLSVTYGIVTAHGGTIELLDGSAGHTTFVVELPAASMPAPARTDVPPAMTGSS